MKKRYKLVLFVATMVVISGAGYYAWSLFEMNQKIKQTILTRLDARFGDQVRIGDIEHDFGTLHLVDVVYTSADSSVRLWAEDISLDYDLNSFVRGGFRLDQTKQVILLHRPRLTIRRSDSLALPTAGGASASISKTFAPLFQSLTKARDLIKIIHFSGGEIYIENAATGETNAILSMITGWAEYLPSGVFATRLASAFSSDRHNVIIGSTVNLESGLLDSVTVQAEFDMSMPQPYFQLPEAVFSRGIVRASVTVYEDLEADKLRHRGYLTAENLSASIEERGLYMDELYLGATLAQDTLRISEGSFRLNNSPFSIAGSVLRPWAPSFDLTCTSPAFDFGGFLAALEPDTRIGIEGTGMLELRLEDALSSLRISGEMAADSLSVANLQFHNIHGGLSVQDSVLSLEKVVANHRETRLEGWGRIHLNTPGKLVVASLFADGDFSETLSALNLIELPYVRGLVTASVGGDLASPEFNGYYAFRVPGETGEADIGGNFQVQDWHLNVEGRSRDDSFAFDGSIDNFRTRPVYDVEIRNAGRIAQLAGVPIPRFLTGKYRFDTGVKGVAERLALRLTAFGHESGASEFEAQFSLGRGTGDARLLEGTLQLFPQVSTMLRTRFSAVYDDSSLTFTRIGNERWLKGDLSIAFSGQKQIEGQLQIQSLDLEKISPRNDRDVPKFAGRAFGEIKFGGSLDAPLANAKGWVLDGYLNNVGVFALDAAATLDSNGVAFERFELKKNNRAFLKVDGGIAFGPGKIDLSVQGQNVDVNTMLGTITDADSVLTGLADIDLQFRGTGWPIPVTGSIQIRDGEVMWFSFDKLHFDFSEDGPVASHLADDGLHVGRISYVRNDRYVAEGNGVFPLNKHDSMKVELKGTGNFLSLLEDVTETVQTTKSYGNLALTLGGPYENIRLGPTRLSVLDGTIELDRIARTVHSIEGDLRTEGNFIRIEKLSGMIDDATVRLKNFEALPEGLDHIGAPLVINRDWMSLGYISATSDDRGLPLHIPGLMEEGELGRFVLRGREPFEGDRFAHQIAALNGKAVSREPGFLIAGPWQHPMFRGDVILHDTNLTYPFLLTDEPPDTLMLNILFNADWDLRTLAGKDNRYVRDINYGISQFFVSLGIDSEVSSMYFTGIVRDTTTLAPGEVELSLAPTSFTDSDSAGQLQPSPQAALASDNRNVADLYYLQSRQRRSLVGPDTSSFRVEGYVESTRGTIEYLDLNFRIDKFGAEWDRSELQPVVFGKAWTTVVDSLNQSHNVYLQVSAIDSLSGAKTSRGRMEDIYMELESDNPLYNLSQVRLLSALGIGLGNVRDQAADILTSSTDKVLFKQLLRPVERTLERSLGLDIVRLQSRFTRNVLEMNQLGPDSETTLALLRSTKVTLGKYLSDRMYLLYTGQVAAWPLMDRFQEANLGLRHTFGFEYRINPGLLLQMEYDYNNTLAKEWKEDKRIWLRHSFPF